MSAENEREGEADGRTENKIAQVLLDSKYGDSPYVLARAILQAINFAAHQQAMQALQARVKELEGKLRLSQPPYSPVSQVKVDELVRVSWDLRNKLDAAEQRADRLQAELTQTITNRDQIATQLNEYVAENERLQAEMETLMGNYLREGRQRDRLQAELMELMSRYKEEL